MRKMFILKDGTPLVVREATYNDAVVLIPLLRRIFQTSSEVLTTIGEFQKEDTLEAQLQRIKHFSEAPGKCLFVAEMGSALVGTIDFWNGHRQRIAHTGEFGMGVLPECRDKGIGKCLLETLLEWAKENPLIEKVKLGVFASNARAIHLYKKMGFVEEGRKTNEIKMESGAYFDVIEMYQIVK